MKQFESQDSRYNNNPRSQCELSAIYAAIYVIPVQNDNGVRTWSVVLPKHKMRTIILNILHFPNCNLRFSQIGVLAKMKCYKIYFY